MYGLVDSLDPESFRALSLRAFLEMRRAGITTVGEFHYLHHASAEAADFRLDEALLDAAAEAGIRLVLLQAYYAAGGPGRPVEGAQRRFRSPSLDAYWRQMDRLAGLLDPELQSLGVVAHSLRAATPDETAALHAEAARRDLPFHLHLEEQVREIEECLEAYGARPMELLLDRIEVTPRVTAVHCTHTAPEDMARFLRAGTRSGRHGVHLPDHRGEPGRRHRRSAGDPRGGRSGLPGDGLERPHLHDRGGALAGAGPAPGARAAGRGARRGGALGRSPAGGGDRGRRPGARVDGGRAGGGRDPTGRPGRLRHRRPGHARCSPGGPTRPWPRRSSTGRATARSTPPASGGGGWTTAELAERSAAGGARGEA